MFFKANRFASKTLTWSVLFGFRLCTRQVHPFDILINPSNAKTLVDEFDWEFTHFLGDPT
jgi:hypothetical protein